MTNYSQSNKYGGDGGSSWGDKEDITGPITRLTIRHGEYIDALQITYGSTTGPKHGGDGGSESEISLASGEKIIAVVGRCGTYVDQLQFVTQKSDGTLSSYGPYGGHGGSPFFIIGSIAGFFGRAGTYLDGIGVYADSDQPLVQG